MTLDKETLDFVSTFVLKKPGSDEEVKVGTFWESGPCILYFLRRFGCQVCRWQAKQMNTLIPEFKEKLNGRVIAIGPEMLGAEEFANLKILDADVLYDPDKKLYNALHLKRTSMFGLAGTFLKKATWDTINKSKSDGIGGNLKGDIYQLGGLFGVEKGGKIVYNFCQNDFSEHANLNDLANKFGLSYSAPTEPAPPLCASDSCNLVQAQDESKPEK